jgi:hypothetical protein
MLLSSGTPCANHQVRHALIIIFHQVCHAPVIRYEMCWISGKPCAEVHHALVIRTPCTGHQVRHAPVTRYAMRWSSDTPCAGHQVCHAPVIRKPCAGNLVRHAPVIRYAVRRLPGKPCAGHQVRRVSVTRYAMRRSSGMPCVSHQVCHAPVISNAIMSTRQPQEKSSKVVCKSRYYIRFVVDWFWISFCTLQVTYVCTVGISV